MDPNETLAMLLENIAGEFPEDAAQNARDLADWLDKGGFLPDSDAASDAYNAFVASRRH